MPERIILRLPQSMPVAAKPKRAPTKLWTEPQASPPLSQPKGGAKSGKGPSQRSQRRMLLQRPTSAPALLRGDNFIRRTHEDAFLQNIEDVAVKHTTTTFKREAFEAKAKVADIDMLLDPSLHDLLLLHNKSQRNRAARLAAGGAAVGVRPDSAPPRGGSSPSRGGSSPPRGSGGGGCRSQQGRPASAAPTAWRRDRSNAVPVAASHTEQLRQLCRKLEGDISHHCKRAGVPGELGLHREDAPVQASLSLLEGQLRGLWGQAQTARRVTVALKGDDPQPEGAAPPEAGLLGRT